MNVVTMLALFCLFVLCGALARRFAGSTAHCLTPGDAEEIGPAAGRLDALADAYERGWRPTSTSASRNWKNVSISPNASWHGRRRSRRLAGVPDRDPERTVLRADTGAALTAPRKVSRL